MSPPRAARPRAARFDDAGAQRQRGAARAAQRPRDGRDARDHADGASAGGRSSRHGQRRRDGLPDQAVQPARAGRRSSRRCSRHERGPERGARPLLHALARVARGGRRRRLLQAPQPRLRARARLHRRGTAGASVHRLRAPGRPCGDARRGGGPRTRHRDDLVRESLPLQGRLVPLARLDDHARDRDGPALRRGPRHHRAQARGGEARGAEGRARAPRRHQPRRARRQRRRHPARRSRGPYHPRELRHRAADDRGLRAACGHDAAGTRRDHRPADRPGDLHRHDGADRGRSRVLDRGSLRAGRRAARVPALHRPGPRLRGRADRADHRRARESRRSARPRGSSPSSSRPSPTSCARRSRGCSGSPSCSCTGISARTRDSATPRRSTARRSA